MRDGRLISEGALLIPSETHYRYQRRGRNRQGYAYLLGPGQWLSNKEI